MTRRSSPATRFAVLLGLSITAGIPACLNEYDQFEADSAKVGEEDDAGGSADSAGAGGSADSAGAGGSADSAGVGGSAGSAGAGGLGEGGSAGTAGVCEAPAAACGEECADTSSDEQHCGGCGNSCTAQSAGFECSAGLCLCSAPEHCGDDNGDRGCDEGRCVCDGATCAVGEICERDGAQFTCSCNGGDACSAGMSCCESPQGCFDLQMDPANCGACGRSCAIGETCSLGQCG